jgi:hypothetical protein
MGTATQNPRAKVPAGTDWIPLGPAPGGGELWRSGRVLVTSELATMEYPTGGGQGPTWLVSVSAKGRRPKPHELRRALRAFGMAGAEEDNHNPGIARHFFLPVDPSKRTDCECKTSEVTVVEADGYRWTNPADGPCRGCEFEAVTGRSCPLHGDAR